jgi:hypothetical protein
MPAIVLTRGGANFKAEFTRLLHRKRAMKFTRTALCALSLAGLIAGPLPTLVAPGTVDAAYAKGNGGGNAGGGGNGGGKGNGKSAGKGKPEKLANAPVDDEGIVKKNHGLLASELKGLNAAHASAAALANAAPNSQVGRIAAYQEAALATEAAGEELEKAIEDLAAAEDALQALNDSYTGRTTEEIDADIAGLDPSAPDYTEKLDALNAERAAAAEFEAEQDALETAVADASDAVADAETAVDTAALAEADALNVASGGRILSPEALDYFRGLLDL